TAAGGCSASWLQPAISRAAAASQAWRRIMPGSAQDPAAAVIDEPAVEAGDAEFDIVAYRGEALAFLDQVPDVAGVAVGEDRRCPAISPADRPVLLRGQIAALADVVEIGDGDVGQIRHMGDLMPEPAGDLAEHPVLRADAR